MNNDKDFAIVIILLVGSNECSMCTWWNSGGIEESKFFIANFPPSKQVYFHQC